MSIRIRACMDTIVREPLALCMCECGDFREIPSTSAFRHYVMALAVDPVPTPIS